MQADSLACEGGKRPGARAYGLQERTPPGHNPIAGRWLASWRRAHREPVVARSHQLWPKLQRLRVHVRSRHLGATDRLRRLDCRQMLSQQARLLAFGPDSLHPERLAGHQGQRQRRSQNLAAALTF